MVCKGKGRGIRVGRDIGERGDVGVNRGCLVYR